MRTLWRVLQAAEEAARDESLLTLPALPRARFFHQWLFGQIVGQLEGGHPTAWTLVPRTPGAGPSVLTPWDAAAAQASGAPTVAADESNRIIAVNGPAADLLGWHPDDLVGRRLTTLIPEHLRERHLAAFSSLLLTGTSRIVDRSVPLPALHHDGHLVPVRLFVETQEMADGRTVFVAQLTPRAAASGEEPPAAVPAEQAAPPAPATPVSGSEEAPPAGPRRPPPPRPGPDGHGRDVGAGPARAAGRHGGCAEQHHGSGRTAPHRRGILTQRLADWCVVDLLTEDSRVKRACVVHRDPASLPRRRTGASCCR